ncbi:hypothetical protein Metho_0681 [Methanomethylovorans hollandica DSM 15978]|uniref:Uncharacterized protein n=1 Tax=Methanomethylovorans hollandica (strain DSM 15978 / NBRC 107637 / DMS1) TaxID=867904 RepID=L0KU41_METHD|nr:hypothetical protein [Methanomethylovorans hollandica]AGB48937.1 hypothetical protein Metho_0681 [Methanomethylovorans hollandica DSM 15978]
MINKNNNDVGPRHDPTIENCATLYRNDSQVYNTNPSVSDDLQQLRNESVIRDFANVTPDTYALIKATNPTLLMFVNLAKKIMEAVG